MTRLLSIITILTGIVVAVFNAPPPVAPLSSNIRVSSPATPLMPPLIFDHGYLWHPEDKNEIVYESFNDEKTIIHKDLPGIPRQWQAAPVLNTGIFHIFWINDRNELWHAQINSAGAFVLRPVRLAEATVLDFDVDGLDNGGAIILWQLQGEFATPVTYNVLDATGRPRFPLEILPDASLFAVSSINDTVHIVWTTALGIEARQRTYTLEQLRQREFEVETTIIPLNIAENQWLTDFELFTFNERPALIYGTQGTDAPEIVNYQVITDGSAHSLETDADALRWLRQSGQDITVSALIDGQWQAGMVDLSLDGPATLRTFDDIPADASPVAVWETDEEKWTAGWATLEGEEILYHVISNWQEQQPPPEERNRSILWLAILWLLVTAGITRLKVDWKADQQRLFLLIAYWSLKAGTALWWLNEQTLENGLALLIIAGVSVICWFAAGKRNLVFFGVDALLTVLWILLA